MKMQALVAQSYPTLCDPMDCSLPVSSVHGILQARILEWVAIPFPGDLPYLGIEPRSPALEADSLLSEPQTGSTSGKESACNAGDLVQFQGQEDPLGKEMAIHSSILAWRIPWTEELGGLQSMGLQRVAHDWAHTHAWYPFYVESKKVIISLFLLFLMVWQEVLQSSTMWRWWWFSPSVVSDSCDSVDCSLPGSSVYGIFQARVLEWVASSFSSGSSQPMIKPRSPALQADALPSEPAGKPFYRVFSIEGLNSSSAWSWDHWNVTRFHWSFEMMCAGPFCCCNFGRFPYCQSSTPAPTSTYDLFLGPSVQFSSVQFSSVQSLSRVQLFVTPWIAARQASLSITNSQSSLRLTSIESMMPSSHLIVGRPLLLLPPIPPSIRVLSNESALHMRWPKYWSFSFSIIPSKGIPGLISFRMDWLDLLADLLAS